MLKEAVSLDLIRQAQNRLRGHVHRTPLVRSTALSERLRRDVYLKLECLQKTGSFKPRGAFNKLLSLSPEERAAGVVAFSGGNHAQGVAFAARELGLRTVICMPETTAANYVAATRDYGAEIVFGPNIAAVVAEASRLQAEGMTLIHPFDDPLVAAGQGTIGLEVLEDLPDVSRMYVSIGGGGLIAGIASALKSVSPSVKLFGVETAGADAMSRSLAAGQLIEMPAITSIAKTLGAPCVSQLTLSSVQKLVEEVLVVEDAEAFRALEFLLERTKILTEPAAACVLAAAERHRGSYAADEKIVLLLCGGNVSLTDLCEYRRRFGGRDEGSRTN